MYSYFLVIEKYFSNPVHQFVFSFWWIGWFLKGGGTSNKWKKLIELNIEKKKERLDLIDKGVSQRNIADKYGVS